MFSVATATFTFAFITLGLAGLGSIRHLISNLQDNIVGLTLNKNYNLDLHNSSKVRTQQIVLKTSNI